MEKTSEMKSKFDDAVKSSSKNQNCASSTAEKYAEYIGKINSFKSGAEKKCK